MPYVPVANTVMAEFRYDLQLVPVENTLYFENVSPWNTTSMSDLGTALVAWWSTNIFPLMNSSATLREIYLTDLTTQTSPALSITGGLPLNGEIALEPMPNNVAACISFRTAARGRSFRGRNYLTGLSQSQVLGNFLLAGVAEDYVAAYTALFAAASDVGGDWVVVSRYSGHTIVNGKRVPTPRAAGVTTPVTAALFADLKIDTQRGRMS